MSLTKFQEQVRSLCDAATRGPWSARRGSGTVVIDASPDWDHCILAPMDAKGNRDADREFIAQSRTIIEAQAEIISLLIRQRDGYRDNYHAACRMGADSRREIIESNDAELNALAAKAMGDK